MLNFSLKRHSREDDNPNSGHKKLKVAKSFMELVVEACRGEYEDFRGYLIENDIDGITLCGIDDSKHDLGLLAKAFEGTAVESLDLSKNHILKTQSIINFTAELTSNKLVKINFDHQYALEDESIGSYSRWTSAVVELPLEKKRRFISLTAEHSETFVALIFNYYPLIEVGELLKLWINKISPQFFNALYFTYLEKLQCKHSLNIAISEVIAIVNSETMVEDHHIGHVMEQLFVVQHKFNITLNKLIEALLDYTLQQGNGFLLLYLSKNYLALIKQIKKQWFHEKDPREISLKKLGRYYTQHNPEFASQILFQFSSHFGSVDYDGGALTLAQIQQRKVKRYCFDPAIIESHKIEDYFNILQKIPGPFSEKFIVVGTHWICGVLEKDALGQVNVLVMDSLGLIGEPLAVTRDTLSAIATNFNNQYRIYMDETQRQHTATGCYIFALDDVQHLFTLEQNWKSQKYDLSLFEFLEINKTHVINIAHIKVAATKQPLSLMRTMQSRKLIQEVIPQRAPNEPTYVDKKKETALVSAVKYFTQSDGEKYDINQRLNYKLKKMRTYNEAYILTTDQPVRTQMMNRFALHQVAAKIDSKSTITSVKKQKFN